MTQRELLTLRHQLQLKADLNPDNFKSAASTGRKLTSYNATQSSVQTNDPTPNRPFSADRMAQPRTVGLRHGQLQQQDYRIEERSNNHTNEMPIRRRFPSQEPVLHMHHDSFQFSLDENIHSDIVIYIYIYLL